MAAGTLPILTPEGEARERIDEVLRAAGWPVQLGQDKVNLDVFWLRDESLEETANLPEPDALAAGIVDDL